MIVSLIVSIGKHRQLGKDNALLWQLRDDLKHFKNMTKGHYIIMGRKTYESIGKPLPNRTTVIISRQNNYQVDGAITVASLRQAIDLAMEAGESEAFIVGGESIYREGLELCDRLIVTHVDYDGDADCYFPPYEHFNWEVEDNFSCPKNEMNQFCFSVQTLTKVR